MIHDLHVLATRSFEFAKRHPLTSLAVVLVVAALIASAFGVPVMGVVR